MHLLNFKGKGHVIFRIDTCSLLLCVSSCWWCACQGKVISHLVLSRWLCGAGDGGRMPSSYPQERKASSEMSWEYSAFACSLHWRGLSLLARISGGAGEAGPDNGQRYCSNKTRNCSMFVQTRSVCRDASYPLCVTKARLPPEISFWRHLCLEAVHARACHISFLCLCLVAFF